MKIELVIHPFYLENGSDKLELRQMVFGSNSRVAELTGIERTAMTYTSLENRFTLLFTSDDAGTRSGFRATYRAIQPGKQMKVLRDKLLFYMIILLPLL